MIIDFAKFSNDAIEPTKGNPDSAGFDLYSTENILVAPSSVIPSGYFRKNYARSGFAVKFTDVGGGIVDADSRVSVYVILFNFSKNIIETEKGSRFAQIVFQKCAHARLREVETFDARSTLRGQSGFSSTRLKQFFFKC